MYTILPICIRSAKHSKGEGEKRHSKISWNQQNDFHFNYLLIDLQFVTDQKLHTCTYVCAYISIDLLWIDGLGAAWMCWAWQVWQAWPACQLCMCDCAAVFAALRIFNWKCYRIYEIVNMQYKYMCARTHTHTERHDHTHRTLSPQTATPTHTHTRPRMQVLTTHIWHIYIQLVCEM